MSYSISLTTIGKFDDKQLTLLFNGRIIGQSKWTSKPELASSIFEDDFFETKSEIHEQSKVYWIKSLYIYPQHRNSGHFKELCDRTFEEIERHRHQDHWIGLMVAPYNDQPMKITKSKLTDIYKSYGMRKFHDAMMFKR